MVNKYIIGFLIAVCNVISCSYIGPSIPSYHEMRVGTCVTYRLVDSDGSIFETVGLRLDDDSIVLFVGENSSYSTGNEFKNFVGQRIMVEGEVDATNGYMLRLRNKYVGFPGWERRMSASSVTRFSIIRVEKVRHSQAANANGGGAHRKFPHRKFPHRKFPGNMPESL